MIDPMEPTVASAGGDGAAGSPWHDPGLVVALALLVVGSFVALSIDVPRTLRGIKGDEATYVAMALSLAHDGDLVYEDGVDLERFFARYDGGPSGIFLKIGVRSFYEFDGSFPFIHRETYPDGRDDRHYFGKAFIFSLFAAPFVRVAGLNGLLWFNVVLLAGVLFGAYRFLRARSPAPVALAWAVAFLGASVVPLYAVWLSSDLFQFALVLFAYLLWFYKDVAPAPSTAVGRWLRSPASDLVAAGLLGLAIYSKAIPIFLFIAPPVLHLWRHRRFRHGCAVGFLSAAVAIGGFVVNAAVSGEFNHQGGLDRKYIAGEYPFDGSGVAFEDLGNPTTGSGGFVVEDPLGPLGFLTLLFRNLGYFLVGRHFGFIPFFFPGAVATLLFLRYRAEARMWQWVVLGTAAFAAVGLAIYMPFTWSGGGGPTGNRYFLSAYPLFLFLMPPMRGLGPTLTAWAGGALFTAQILINPFVSAKEPYLAPAQGVLRWLPVELTMVLDLPIMLDAPRARVLHGENQEMQLYFLDHHASLPEPGIWIDGGQRADIIVKTTTELEAITVTATAPIANVVTIDIGSGEGRIELEPGAPGSVTIRPSGVYSRDSWAYLMRVRARDGFVPRLTEPGSDDGRFLGAAISLTVVPVRSP